MKLFLCPLLFFAAHLFSFDDTPGCFRELQQNFFSQKAISEALSLSNVSQSLWYPIIGDLNREQRRLPAAITARARAMSQNPMRRPFQREAAFELLYQEARRIYTGVLLQNGVTNPVVIDQTFNYIYQSAFERISACYEATPPSPSGG